MTLDYDKRIPERGYKKNNLNNEAGTKVVPINPLSYDWETEMLNVAKALTPMDPE